MKKQLLILLILTTVSFYSWAQSFPCCTPEYRQFDFWLGLWEVYDTNDQIIGRNHIKLMQDSCVLQENWQAAKSPYSGTSYNYYNKITGNWEQLWIDNQGQHLNLTGGLSSESMVLQGARREGRKGNEYINRITWTPQSYKIVQQHWEISYDDGDTWKTIFDGEYRKVQ